MTWSISSAPLGWSALGLQLAEVDEEVDAGVGIGLGVNQSINLAFAGVKEYAPKNRKKIMVTKTSTLPLFTFPHLPLPPTLFYLSLPSLTLPFC